MEIINCLVCNDERTQKGYLKLEDKFTKDKVQYYNCDNCGLQFVYPQNWDRLKELYKKDFRDKISLKQHIIYRLPYSKRHQFTFKFLKEIKKGTMLDLGAGEGKFSWLMKLRGWKVLANEPTKHYAEFAQKTYGLTVKSCFFEELDLNYKFDLVVLSAILEHLPEQVESLKKLKEFVKNDGHVFIRIPHSESKWYGAPHLFLHSKKSINHVFDKAGLRITKMDTFKREFYILGSIKS